MVQPEHGEVAAACRPPEVQDTILGKRGAEAWRNGQWPASQWSQLRVTDGWRDSWNSQGADDQRGRHWQLEQQADWVEHGPHQG